MNYENWQGEPQDFHLCLYNTNDNNTKSKERLCLYFILPRSKRFIFECFSQFVWLHLRDITPLDLIAKCVQRAIFSLFILPPHYAWVLARSCRFMVQVLLRLLDVSYYHIRLGLKTVCPLSHGLVLWINPWCVTGKYSVRRQFAIFTSFLHNFGLFLITCAKKWRRNGPI